MDKQVSDTNPLNNTTTYQYDVLGREVQLTEPNGNVVRTYYNDTGSWVRRTDENGSYFCSVYDRLGRLISVVEFSDSKCNAPLLSGHYYLTNYYYDEVGNLRRTVSANENLFVNPGFETGTFYGWTRTGMAVRGPGHTGTAAAVQNVSGCIPVAFTLQENFAALVPGRMITSFQFWYMGGDPNNGVNPIVQVLYSDGTNSQTSLISPGTWTMVKVNVDTTKNVVGIEISAAKASSCFPTFSFDDFLLTAPQTEVFSYDSLNRLVRTDYSDGTFESYNYDSNNNIAGKIDRNGVRTAYSYDSLDRVSSITHGNTGTSDSYTYDRDGNLLELQSQNATMGYTYDSRNRVTEECYYVNNPFSGCPYSPGGGGSGSVAEGTLITLANGTQVPVQDITPGNKVIAYNAPTEYQTVATVSQIRRVTTNSTLTIHTTAGLPFRADANPLMKLWILTGTGTVEKPITLIQPGDKIYNYDVGSWVSVSGVTITYGGQHTMYDLTITPSFTSTGLLLEYIANGYPDCYNICKMGPVSGPTGSSPSGGIIGSQYFVKYAYAGENLYSISYPDGLVVNYTYDTLGRLLSASKPGGPVYAGFSYYRDDSVRGVTYGNGLVGNYTFDNLARVSSIGLNNTSTRPATSLFHLNYQYNKTGTVASVTGQVNSVATSEQYNYDPLARLTNASLTTGTGHNAITTPLWYQYDVFGNRQRQSSNGILSTYSYNQANNELVSSSTSGTATTYSYDANGNLLSKSSAGNSWVYGWDVAGHLLKASLNNVPQGYYAYDGLGRRLESNENTWTFYSYHGTETLSEYYINGTENDYVFAGNLRITRATGSSLFYYHTDALGSTRLVTSSTKTVVFSDNYQPYGQDNGSTGSETYRFTGKPYSSATGFYYELERWYDASTGRFVSRDPLPGDAPSPQSLNGYAYVRNLPTVLRDPTGMNVLNCGVDGCDDPSARSSTGNAGGGGSTIGAGDPPLPPPENEIRVTAPPNIQELSSTQLDASTTSTTTIADTNPTVGATEPASQADTVGQNAGRGIKVYQVGSYPGYDTPWVTSENYMTQGEFQEKLSLPPHNTASWFREMVVSENGLTEPQVVEPQYGHLGGGIEMRIIDPNAIIYTGPWIPTIALVLALSL